MYCAGIIDLSGDLYGDLVLDLRRLGDLDLERDRLRPRYERALFARYERLSRSLRSCFRSRDDGDLDRLGDLFALTLCLAL